MKEASRYFIAIVFSIIAGLILSSWGCGNKNGPYIKINGWDITKYAETKVEEYFGVSPKHGNIMMGSFETVAAACGGQACNKGGTIIIHETTNEYICQQLVHELGHSAIYQLEKDWDYNHQNSFYTSGVISEMCGVYNGV